MKLKFKFIDDGHIHIISIDEKTKKTRIVGRIFTPSGSGQDSKNAIQVCGFSEAFDLWGCAVFAKPKTKTEVEYVRDGKGEKVFEMAKDIQLMFDSETRSVSDLGNDCCWCCFNNPCTCEVKVRHDNPYTVKREQDIFIERVKEVKK
jgi:hypothetical protein